MTALSGMTSHSGNAYSYYVGAYWKTRPIKYGDRNIIDLTGHDFDIEPNFPLEGGPLGVQLSLDLVASRSDSEYFAECKHSQALRSLGVNSREFKEGILEFIGLERYRKTTFRRQVEYLFVTNNSVGELIEEVLRLKASSTSELEEYRVEMIKAAKKKWRDFNGDISEKDLRAVLGRIMIVQVGDGALDEAESESEFQSILSQLVSRARKKGIQLPMPLAAIVEDSIRISCDPSIYEFVRFQTLGYSVQIQQNIWSQLKDFFERLGDVDTIRRIDGLMLPFLATLKVESTGIPNEMIGRVFSEIVNDRILAKIVASHAFLQISIDDRNVFVSNLKWMLQVSKAHRSGDGKYKSSEIAAVLPFPVTFRMVELIISEANRIQGIVIDDGSFERDS